MARTRTSGASLERNAVDALVDAVRELGLEIRAGRHGSDLELRAPGTPGLALELKATALPTDSVVRGMIERRPQGPGQVLVADQISAAVRAALNEAGIAWFDRRGHLRLVGQGIYIDADVSPRLRSGASSSTSEPINGRSGLAAAAALLVRPDDPPGVTEVARIAGLNPSSITRAFHALVRAHLAERRGRGSYRALVPELFWALADVWPRDRVTIPWSRALEDDPRLGMGRDPAEPGWAAAGVRGAVAWGAPLTATGDYPLEFYVPDEEIVRRASALAYPDADVEAALTVDPIGLVTRTRRHVPSLSWPAAHPLFCALDLAASSRDREALEQWTPPPEFTRVW
jgi:hypothetical protein